MIGLDPAPGQPGELATQPGLAALHRQHPVRAPNPQVGDVLALGVQRIGGDHHTGQIDAGQGVEQRRERGDLVRLALDVDLAEHGPGLLIDHGEQMTSGAMRAARAAHGFAVHGQHPAPPDEIGSHAQALHEPADHRVEPVGVHPAQDPADRRLRRAPMVDAQHDRDIDRQVRDPLGHRDERSCPGCDRAHRRGQHHHQPVSDPAALARIGHLDQRIGQPRSQRDRIG